MKCEQFKSNLSLRVGELFLDDEEKMHLNSCPECKQYYKGISALEENLASLEIEPMTDKEFTNLSNNLDSAIEESQSKGVRYYNMLIRYGASLAAVIILLFFSFFHGFKTQVTKPINTDSLLTALQVPDTTQVSDNEQIDTPYVNVLVNNYVEDHGSSSSEMLIGDLSQEEMEYLENKMKAGDIL